MGTKLLAQKSIVALGVILTITSLFLIVAIYLFQAEQVVGNDLTIIEAQAHQHGPIHPAYDRSGARMAVAELLSEAPISVTDISHESLADLQLNVYLPTAILSEQNGEVFVTSEFLEAMTIELIGPAQSIQIDIENQESHLETFEFEGERYLEGPISGTISYKNGVVASVSIGTVINVDQKTGNFSFIFAAHNDVPQFGMGFGALDLSPELIDTIFPEHTTE